MNEQSDKPQYSSNLTHKQLVDTSKATPIEGGQYQNIGGIWTLKHDTISLKFFELLLKLNLKGYNDLDLNNL